MISTDQMISQIPAKDAWKMINEDRRKNVYNVLPKFPQILFDFEPSELTEDQIAEFYRRYPDRYWDAFYSGYLEGSNSCVSLPFFRIIQKLSEEDAAKEALERSYVKLLEAAADYRDGLVDDTYISRVYENTRKKLIAAIGRKVCAHTDCPAHCSDSQIGRNHK